MRKYKTKRKPRATVCTPHIDVFEKGRYLAIGLEMRRLEGPVMVIEGGSLCHCGKPHRFRILRPVPNPHGRGFIPQYFCSEVCKVNGR